MDTFRQKVLEYILAVPKGNVVSYGQVAAAAGSPRAARQVGGILRSYNGDEKKLPWWRVVNNAGIISIKGNWTATKELQATLLRQEGIVVDTDYSLDMEKYRYVNKKDSHKLS